MGRFLPNLADLLFEDYCRTHGIPPPESLDSTILCDLAYPVCDPLYPPRGSHHAPEPAPDNTQAERERRKAENAALKATKRKQRK